MDGVTLRGHLLGRTRVVVGSDCDVTHWPRPTARRLVSLLLLAPDHVMTRDQIAEHLFPHLEPPKAARAVSKALSQARAALDGHADHSVLVADRASIAFADDVEVTVDIDAHLSALRSAIAETDPRRREAGLRDALDNDAPVLVEDAYEDWALVVIGHVERVRREARMALARASGAVGDWQAVADADPANAQACAALVAAHQAADRPNEAARVAATYRRAVAELGLPPDPALVPTGTGQAQADILAPPAWPLFGRDVELDLIVQALGPAADGQGAAVLVSASAGMGKTHLVTHAASRFAADGWTIATGTSDPQDRLAPFASLRSALLGHLVNGPLPTLVRRFLHPEAVETLRPPMQPAELAALADALRLQLDRVSGGAPLLLLLDDIHWADRAQQLVLGRLASAGIGRRWSLLLAARTDEPGSPVPPLPSSVVHVHLGPLGDEASERLAAHVLEATGTSSPARAREVAERGRGHPFFTVELARSIDADSDGSEELAVPERIVDLLRRRLAACSPPARRLTALIAVAGDDASLPVIADAATTLLGGDDLADILDELARTHLVYEAKTALRLVHPLLRDAAESTINPVRRAQLHSHVADALERAAAAGAGSTRLSVARHRLAAFTATGMGEHAERAVPAAFAGGRIARQLGGADAAAELLAGGLGAFETLDAPRRLALRQAAFDTWISLGEVRLDLGEYDPAQQAFDAAMGLAMTPDERAVVWRWLSHHRYRQGDLAGAIAVAEDALPSLPEDAGLARARLLAESGWAHFRRGDTTEALTQLARAVEFAEDTGDWAVVTQSIDRHAFVLAEAGRLDDALALFERALTLAPRCGNAHEEAIARIHYSMALTALERHDDGVVELDRAAEICEQNGHLYTRSVAHWGRAVLEASRGDLEKALAERDAEARLLDALGNDRNLAGCHLHRTELLRALGRETDAAEAAEAARCAAERTGDPAFLESVARATGGGNTAGASVRMVRREPHQGHRP